MEREPSRRDEQVAWIFASILEPIHRLFSRLDLTEEETEALDRELYGWFYRFTRRTGQDGLSGRAMRGALLSGAVQLMRDVATLKQCSIPLIPRDLREIAEQLGVQLNGAEESSP